MGCDGHVSIPGSALQSTRSRTRTGHAHGRRGTEVSEGTRGGRRQAHKNMIAHTMQKDGFIWVHMGVLVSGSLHDRMPPGLPSAPRSRP